MKSSTEFDIRTDGEAYERGSIRFRRRMLLLYGSFGVAMCAVGAVLFVGGTPNGGPETSQHYFYLVLIGMGGVILATCLWTYRTFPTAARSLGVGPDGIEIVRPDGGTVGISWKEFPEQLSLVDWRALPARERGRALRRVEFILSSKKGVQTAIPHAAARTIVDEARDHGLRVIGWTSEAAASGPARRITFEDSGRAMRR